MYTDNVDFNSDEDDLLGDDDLLVDNSSYENYDELAINHDNQDKMNDNDKNEIERLTKELNTLKLAHETTLEDHRELLKTQEKLRFGKLNLEKEGVEMIVMNEDPHGEDRIRKERTSHQGATQNEDIKLMLANGYPAPTLTTTPREVITQTPV